jgi:hypothetical protein
MEEDLNLGDGSRHSSILMLFFPSYFLTDVPSNWILTRVSPRLWLAFLMFAWCAVLVGMAFTNNWQVMAFLRFLLGAFEGGVIPGVTFVIPCWCVMLRCSHHFSVLIFLQVHSEGASQTDSVRLWLWTCFVSFCRHHLLWPEPNGWDLLNKLSTVNEATYKPC